MENNRAFTGMWIPAAIWLHEDLNITEKCLIAEIVSLNNNAGGCFASNAHFSKFLNLSKNRVSAILSSLQDRGWIRMINERKNNQIIKRQIFIAFNYGPTGMPTPKSKEEPERQNEDVPNPEEGIPHSEGGIPNTEEGVPSTEEPLPYSEGGIPNSRKVNSHLNNHLNNQLNNQDHNKSDEKETTKPTSFSFYESNGFGTLSSVVVQSIFAWIDDFKQIGSSEKEADEIITYALKESVFANKRYWKYTNGILKNWHNSKLTNLGMIEAAEKEREANKSKSKPYNKHQRTESLPEWARPGYEAEPDRPLTEEELELDNQKRRERLEKRKANLQHSKEMNTPSEKENQAHSFDAETTQMQQDPLVDEMIAGLFN